MLDTYIIPKPRLSIVRIALLGALISLSGCDVGEMEVDLFGQGPDPDEEPLVGDTDSAGGTDTESDRDLDSDLDSDIDSDDVSVEPAGDLFISEVMANPQAVTDSDGEWFEIGNASALVLDLFDVVVDNGTNSFTIDEHILLAPDDVVTFGRNDDPETNGDLSIDFSYSGLTLTNTEGELYLYRNDRLIDSVAWAAESELVMPSGGSIQWDPQTAEWCASVSTWTQEEIEEATPAGDLGSPGEVNPPCDDSSDQNEETDEGDSEGESEGGNESYNI